MKFQRKFRDKSMMMSRYDGEILMNLMDGAGEFRWPNGDRYTGTYVNGRRYSKHFLKGQFHEKIVVAEVIYF
jgi:hypothetical protein